VAAANDRPWAVNVKENTARKRIGFTKTPSPAGKLKRLGADGLRRIPISAIRKMN
jgi:hypothetical protein